MANARIVLNGKANFRLWFFSFATFHQRQIENCEKQDTLAFALSDQGDIPIVDFSKFETRRFQDSLGREIAVFDGLLNSKDLDALRLFLLQYNSAFMHQDYDTSSDEEHDNVSWIAMLKVYLSHVLFMFLLVFYCFTSCICWKLLPFNIT